MNEEVYALGKEALGLLDKAEMATLGFYRSPNFKDNLTSLQTIFQHLEVVTKAHGLKYLSQDLHKLNVVLTNIESKQSFDKYHMKKKLNLYRQIFMQIYREEEGDVNGCNRALLKIKYT